MRWGNNLRKTEIQGMQEERGKQTHRKKERYFGGAERRAELEKRKISEGIRSNEKNLEFKGGTTGG